MTTAALNLILKRLVEDESDGYLRFLGRPDNLLTENIAHAISHFCCAFKRKKECGEIQIQRGEFTILVGVFDNKPSLLNSI